MNHINLVPIEYKKTLKRKRYIGFGVIMGIISIMGLLFLTFLPMHYIEIQQNEQVILDQMLTHKNLEPAITVMEAIKESKEEQLNAQLILDQIDFTSHITRTTMDIIVGSAPKGLRINELTIEGAQNIMNIKGNALDVKTIVAYIVALYYTEQFENIVYTTHYNKSLQTEGWIDYNLEIKLKSFTNKNGEAL